MAWEGDVDQGHVGRGSGEGVAVMGADEKEVAGGELVALAVDVVRTLTGLNPEDFGEVVGVGAMAGAGVIDGAGDVAALGRGEDVLEMQQEGHEGRLSKKGEGQQ